MSKKNTEKPNTVTSVTFNPFNGKGFDAFPGHQFRQDGAYATLLQWRKNGFAVYEGQHGERIDWTDKNGNSRHYYVFHRQQVQALESAREDLIEKYEDECDDRREARDAKKREEREARRKAREARKAAREPEKAEATPEPAPEISDRIAALMTTYSQAEILEAHALIMGAISKAAQIVPPAKPEPEIPEAEEATPEIPKKPVGLILPEITKGEYRIRFKAGTEIVAGYTFEALGVSYGVRKIGKTWEVSELSTGLFVVSGNTRKAAIVELYTERREGKTVAELVAEGAKAGKYKAAQEYMAKVYEEAAEGGC